MSSPAVPAPSELRNFAMIAREFYVELLHAGFRRWEALVFLAHYISAVNKGMED